MVKQQNSCPPRRFASYAYGLESYLKDPKKRRARKRESYMKESNYAPLYSCDLHPRQTSCAACLVINNKE